jgi:hypothetical protein
VEKLAPRGPPQPASVRSHHVVAPLTRPSISTSLCSTFDMGGICSKSSNMSGGHTVLGSSSSATVPTSPQGDTRAAAAEAAERRRLDVRLR